ncbi:MAG TPA: tRNA uridine-5-carboxymethylaminomethyl(34) synthesis enzyme MnmG, partial [Pseudomonadales bacterium]
VRYADIARISGSDITDNSVIEQVEIQGKYEGYIARQQEEIDRFRRYENTPIGDSIDYSSIEGLSNEVKQKLADARPETLGRASRVPGVTPAAISLLLVYMKKNGFLGREKIA